MKDVILTQYAGYLCILWFLTGRQFGHVFAKYARSKTASKIVAVVLCLFTLATTWFIFSN